jgi:small subunit ribosomal protein S3
MGQKVNPIGIRLGITRDWSSKWYAGKKQFPLHIHTDFRVREFLRKKLAEASVSRVQIERAARKVNITIQTARPGIVIGKKGEDIEKLRQETAKLLGMPVDRRPPEHRRDPQARARRAAGGRRHRAADREARDVPPRDEARRDEHDALAARSASRCACRAA